MMRETFEQYFTPVSVADALIDLLDIRKGDRVIDPSAGEGVFLRAAAARGAIVVGVDLDPEMAVGDIYRHNGLYSDAMFPGDEPIPVPEDAWDVVVGNPPFKNHGDSEARPEVLRRYALGCHPATDRLTLFDSGPEPAPLPAQAPEVLFLERFVNLARPGGRIGIVLPDGVVSKAARQPARDFLLERCELYAVIGLPRETFLDLGTEAKTVVVIARKKPAPRPSTGLVCLAEARFVGVRSQENDLPEIVSAYRKSTSLMEPLVIWKPVDEIRSRMTPGYYDPRYARILGELRESGFDFVELRELAPYIAYGKTGARHYTPNGAVQLLSIRNHEPTGVDFYEELRFVAEGSHNDPSRSRLQVGDILLSNTGIRAIGRATLVTSLPHPANVTQHIQLVRPAPNVGAEAIVTFLQSRYGQIQIEQRITGVASAALTNEDIRSILVPRFGPAQQAVIHARYRAMDREHQRAQAARRQISEGVDAHRRLEQISERAEKLRQALVADMESTIASGEFSF